jgi:hypothetical protein
MEKRNGWERGNWENWTFLEEENRNGTSQRRSHWSLKEERKLKQVTCHEDERGKRNIIYWKRWLKERRNG